MRHPGLHSIGFVLGATFPVLASTAHTPHGTAEILDSGTAVRPSLQAYDSHPFNITDLPPEVAAVDRPTCLGLPASAGGVGTDRDDVITATSGPDVIVAGAGNDVIRGRDGRDVICGGSGDDTLVGDRHPAKSSQAKHGDRLFGGPGDDRIVDNGGYRDKLIGGSGNDRLRSRNGTYKRLRGGPGDDRLISDYGYDNALFGGSGADIITALTGLGIGRYHSGGSGRDVIDVGPGGDVGVGLTGDGDLLRVHRDASLIPSYSGSPVGVEVDMRTGTVRRIGAAPTDPADVITFLSQEGSIWYLYGSAHGDVFNGSEGDDRFFALAGNDTLNGNGGDDSLSGFGGNDFIDGGDGEDYADGGASTDTCIAEEVHKCER
ncbi:calcium-binding protein [Microvirga sp. 0TCS3.31]